MAIIANCGNGHLAVPFHPVTSAKGDGLHLMLMARGTLIGFAIVSTGCDQPSSVKPLISKLKEPGTQTATISLGSEAGVNLGDDFDVYRENKQLGKLKITKVEPDQSTATISETYGPQKLETGDVVIRDVTLQFLRQLERNSGPATAAETGRAFAEADIASGINRILYYGPPWSDGKPLIDEETGYWDKTANPKTVENAAQEYAASEAIRKLRELPESKPVIEEVLAKWFASVEHEVNEVQLTRAAKCIVFAAGPRNQKAAVDYLFKIWTQFREQRTNVVFALVLQGSNYRDLLSVITKNCSQYASQGSIKKCSILRSV